jgi:long-chain acyl-CoA synthetase
LIGQAFVHGDSLQTYLVAVIVPEEEAVRNMLEGSGEAELAKATFSDICKSEALKAFITKEIKRIAKENGLHGFEIPRSVHLADELFSVENGLLTPTFKLKRQQARDKYEKEIERMYATIVKPKSNL